MPLVAGGPKMVLATPTALATVPEMPAECSTQLVKEDRKEAATSNSTMDAVAVVEEDCCCNLCRYSPVCICAFLAPLAFTGM